ncbi:hypothetical protein [Micromonospora zhanjiangensis]|uniref:Uncharacterized protein n=1 Tax=Micromonospora zhanjiangensis TaxID=1522057 RepID=A0ABV8KSY5_9ACTN
MVDDDLVRDDDRPGGGLPHPRVDVDEPGVWQPGRGHAQRVGQPGRIGSGTGIRASSNAASTALVPTGRSTPAQIVRVATSTAMVGFARAISPVSSSTITSIGVESICTCSPGRDANVGVNAPAGRLAVCRRVTAEPKVCLPADSRSTSA